MPVARLHDTSSSGDLMKSDEGNGSLDTCIRQAIGKEPFYSFTRAGESQIQWFQTLNVFDQPDISGWPLFSPVKVQMRKCDKCSQEFCSTINYRRHIRCHRRSLNLDKDSAAKNRDRLQVYWDKLSTDEAIEVLSFKEVNLEEVSGASIVTALTSFIRKPGFTQLPHAYVKAGSALLDIIQGRPSRFPLSAQELFSVLDDASENTFLSAGTAEALQKFVFDGQAGKIGLELKNLIACTSFVIEQKLVKAWLADKDAEALRFQKMLVEEEEAAQKRKAVRSEKRRQKKIRQKEQKVKEQANGERADTIDEATSTTESATSAPTASLADISDSDSQTPHDTQDSVPLLSEPDPVDVEVVASNEPHLGLNGGHPDSGTYQNVERRFIKKNVRRQLVNYRWQGSKVQQQNGFYMGPNHQVMKVASTKKPAAYRDSKTAAVGNVSKVWTPKPKSEADEENSKVRLQNEPKKLQDLNTDSQVLIGSISVTLGNKCHQEQDGNHEAAGNGRLPSPKENDKEKNAKPDRLEVGQGRSTVKIWRPVSAHGHGAAPPVREGIEEAKVDALSCPGSDDLPSICSANDNGGIEELNDGCGSCKPSPECGPVDEFSVHAAEAFLAQRWKEAMASEPVILVLNQEVEPPESSDAKDDSEASPLPVLLNRDVVLNNVENGSSKSKIAAKSQKGNKVRYIPKQR